MWLNWSVPSLQIWLLSLVLALEAVSVFGLKKAIDEQIQQLPPEVGKRTVIKETDKGLHRHTGEASVKID